MPTQNSSRSRAGTERVARRARQATNAEQATKDALLVPPAGGAKKAAAAAAKQTQLARFGGDTPRTVRKAKQADNARKADEENVTLAAPAAADSSRILAGLVPGEQPTNLQLRLLAKAHQGSLRDEATEAGKAAGRVVRDTLLGRNTRATPHSRFRRAASAQDALQRAAANAPK